MTKPRIWPNTADDCRMDCISPARRAKRELVSTLENIDNPLTLRQMAKAIEAMSEIEIRLIKIKGEKTP